jgi:hypothetical protein
MRFGTSNVRSLCRVGAIKMDLREIGIDGANWIRLDSAGSGQDPVAGLCDHGDETSGSIKKAGYCLAS